MLYLKDAVSRAVELVVEVLYSLKKCIDASSDRSVAWLVIENIEDTVLWYKSNGMINLRTSCESLLSII